VTTTYDATSVAESLAAFGALPDWLAAGMDVPRLCAGLARQVPELRDGRLRLLACSPERLRAKEDEWRARYTVVVAEPGGAPRDVVLVGNLWPPGRQPSSTEGDSGVPFGEPGWRCALPDPRLDLQVQTADDALPALPRLADPTQAARLLEPVLRDAGYRDATIATCDPVVVRYKPGSRCTVVVGLTYADRSADPPTGPVPPDRVVVKTHHGDKGESALEAMNALWQPPRPWAAAVRLAEPLGYLADERILVQGPVPGDRLLKDLAREAIVEGGDRLDGFRVQLSATARGLAAVHRSGATYGRTDTLEEELDKVREVVGRLATSVPELAGAARPLVSRLAELTADTDPDPVVPSHHDFRPAQVLLDGDDVAFVDFDGACMAEPALDVGRFRAKLRDTGISALGPDAPQPAPEWVEANLALVDDLCEQFLADYQGWTPVSRERVLLWETCDLLTTLLHAWTKVRVARVEQRLTLLVHQIGTGGLLDRNVSRS
jgi:aminoglycoside phosphotransferase (APT) family kinase protein